MAEFLFAALLNGIGFGWPLRLLFDPGEKLYLYLLTNGFYSSSNDLLVDMNFALKLDFVVNFLLFVWIFFSFPNLLERWIPAKANLGELGIKNSDMK